MWNLFHYATLRHNKYKSTKMNCCCFFKTECYNSRSIWQVNQIQNKRIQSCRSTIILVLDSTTSVLNFVNWIKASFMEKLGFRDIKSVPRRGKSVGWNLHVHKVLTSSCCWHVHRMVGTNCVGIENSRTK